MSQTVLIFPTYIIHKRNRHTLVLGYYDILDPKNQSLKDHKSFSSISSIRASKCPDTPILYTIDMH